MPLLRCTNTNWAENQGRPYTLITAQVVAAVGTPESGPTQYAPINGWHVPEADYSTTGPLALTVVPEGDAPRLTVRRYSRCVLYPCGLVLVFLHIDGSLDATPFVGRVFQAVEIAGERAIEPLLSDVQAPPRPRIPAHAHHLLLSQLGLTDAIRDRLECEQLVTAADLCLRTADELLEVRGIGVTRLAQIRQRLAAVGLWLSGEEPPNLSEIA